MIAVGNNPTDALGKVLAELELDKAEVITIYFGADTELTEAQAVSQNITQEHPDLQVEVVRGDQPHYNYIVSVE